MAHTNTVKEQGGKWVHKLVLYLILVNFLLLYLFFEGMGHYTLAEGGIISCLLLSYNVLLGRMVSRRARRNDDGYIVYPVFFSNVILGFLLFDFFILLR